MFYLIQRYPQLEERHTFGEVSNKHNYTMYIPYLSSLRSYTIYISCNYIMYTYHHHHIYACMHIRSYITIVRYRLSYDRNYMSLIIYRLLYISCNSISYVFILNTITYVPTISRTSLLYKIYITCTIVSYHFL